MENSEIKPIGKCLNVIPVNLAPPNAAGEYIATSTMKNRALMGEEILLKIANAVVDRPEAAQPAVFFPGGTRLMNGKTEYVGASQVRYLLAPTLENSKIPGIEFARQRLFTDGSQIPGMTEVPNSSTTNSNLLDVQKVIVANNDIRRVIFISEPLHLFRMLALLGIQDPDRLKFKYQNRLAEKLSSILLRKIGGSLGSPKLALANWENLEIISVQARQAYRPSLRSMLIDTIGILTLFPSFEEAALKLRAKGKA